MIMQEEEEQSSLTFTPQSLVASAQLLMLSTFALFNVGKCLGEVCPIHSNSHLSAMDVLAICVHIGPGHSHTHHGQNRSAK